MIIRSLLLLLPLSIWVSLLFFNRLSTRELTASFLSFLWAFQACLILNIIAVNIGGWAFLGNDNLFYNVPLDYIFAQAIIIGVLVPLTHLWGWHVTKQLLLQACLIITTFLSIDLTFLTISIGLSALSSIFILSSFALFLFQWTANDTHIYGRALLQSIAWACLLFWLFPSVIFYLTTDNWHALIERDLIINTLYLLPLLIPAYLLSNALYQFAETGGGTAFPYDPPKRLVTTGIYRYISNPMQLGICLAMGWWGVIIESFWIIISALIAVILFIVFKDVCNGSCAIGVNNKEWQKYHSEVPKWWPRYK